MRIWLKSTRLLTMRIYLEHYWRKIQGSYTLSLWISQIEVDEYLEGLEAKDRYMVTLLLMGYSLSDCAKAFHVANSSITWRIKRIRKNYTAYSMAV